MKFSLSPTAIVLMILATEAIAAPLAFANAQNGFKGNNFNRFNANKKAVTPAKTPAKATAKPAATSGGTGAAAAANKGNFNGNANNNNGGNANANNGNNGNNNNNNNNNNGNATGQKVLKAENIQAASSKTGQEAGADPGQKASATDSENFINFCSGKGALTNGLQNQGGSCNGIPMGRIPARNNMISAIITNPKNGENIAANTAIDFRVKINNLAAGAFTNPANTYYAAPQDLDNAGKVIGHTHMSVQKIDSLTTTNVPDPVTFEFFKGINDAGDGRGGLSAQAADGLPAGFYRACTITSAANHQPVVMPVAQRGPQDDCIRFSVGQGGGNNNNNNNGGNNNNNNNGGNNNNNAGNNNAGNNNNGGNNNAGNNNGGNNNGGNNNGGNANNTGGNGAKNLQTFKGAVGAAAEAIVPSGNGARPFKVGVDTFVDFTAAATRTCDRQFNACADVANRQRTVQFQACTTQQQQCNAAQASAKVRTF